MTTIGLKASYAPEYHYTVRGVNVLTLALALRLCAELNVLPTEIEYRS